MAPAFLLGRLGFTPNAVTLLGAAMGLGALAIIAGTDRTAWLVVAVVLLQLWPAMDGADGTLARALRAKDPDFQNPWGGYMDALFHHFLVQLWVVPAFCIAAWRQGGGILFLFLAMIYLWRGHWSTWHHKHMDQTALFWRTGPGKPEPPHADGASKPQLRTYIGYLHDHVSLALVASVAVLLDVAGIWTESLPPWLARPQMLVALLAIPFTLMTLVSILMDFGEESLQSRRRRILRRIQ